MHRVSIVLLVFIMGCAIFGGSTVDKENIPKLEKVVVVSYENNSNYPDLTGTVRWKLNTRLEKITKPQFIPYKDISGEPVVKEITRDKLAKPEERDRIREELGADAVMFCTINSASSSEPPKDAEPGGIEIEEVPTGRKDGSTRIKSVSMSFKSSPRKKAKVSMSVEIISLDTGEVVYSSTKKFHDDRKDYPGEILLKAAARACAGAVMNDYRWPGLKD